MADWPFGFAVRTVRDGLSGRAGLAAYRAGGGSIRDATWFRMVAEARTAVAGRELEVGRPLDRRPVTGEFVQWTTQKARGFIQQVEVIVRDRDTGGVTPLPYSLSGTRTVTRQQAIDSALGHYNTEGTDAARQVFLGAIYVGTYIMTPGVS